MRERGVSTVVSYVLMLGIVALLMTGMVIEFGPFVAGQQQAAAQSTLTVFGQDLAGDIETADRLADSTDGEATVVVTATLPDRIGDRGYDITIAAGDPHHELTLTSSDPDVVVTVPVRTDRPVESEPETLAGGPVHIEYDAAADRLVVHRG